jgi:hypothetical protein
MHLHFCGSQRLPRRTAIWQSLRANQTIEEEPQAAAPTQLPQGTPAAPFWMLKDNRSGPRRAGFGGQQQ